MSNMIPCGGFRVDEKDFEFKDKVLKMKRSEQPQPQLPNMEEYLRADGSTKVKGTIDMDGHNLINITTIGGVHPTYVEESIEAAVASLQHDIELLQAKVAELEKNHPKP